jgi:signal transduction histidine kinase
MEYRLRRHDGQYRWIVDSGAPRVEADGEFIGYIGSAIDITERKQMADELERLGGQLLRAQDDERRRIARELHDGTGQALTAVNLNLTAVRHMLAPAGSDRGTIARMLDDSSALLRQATTEMRTLSYLLHPPQLDAYGLAAALEGYVEGFAQRSGVRIGLQVQKDFGRLPTPVETALYRVAQEALSNVFRHSGSSNARVWLSARAGEVRLRIQDYGRGITAADLEHAVGGSTSGARGHAKLGVGIAGMRQRLQQLGGRLEVHSSPRGTLVSAILPLNGVRPRASGKL